MMSNHKTDHEPVSTQGRRSQSNPEYFKIEDISMYLSIKVKTLYSLVESGDIPHYRIGRLIRFKKRDVDLWMEEKKGAVAFHPYRSNRVFKSSQRNQDIDKKVRKTIDGLKGEGYTLAHGKSDQIEGPTKEKNHGSV